MPNVVCLQKMVPNVCRKTNDDLFFGGHTEKGLNDLCGRKFVGKSRTKTSRTSLGRFGQKSFATPKIFLLLHLWRYKTFETLQLHSRKKLHCKSVNTCSNKILQM